MNIFSISSFQPETRIGFTRSSEYIFRSIKCFPRKQMKPLGAK